MQQILVNALAARPRGVRQDVDMTVVAVVTVEKDRRFLADTVRAVLAQRTLPGVVIVADCSGQTPKPVYSTMEVIRPHAPRVDRLPQVATAQVQLVGVKGAASFGDAVDKALRAARLPETAESVWLLHDDSRPRDPSCLETLVEAHRNVPGASVIGAKQLAWDSDALHNVGYYAAPHHRVASLVVDGEPDQEQYDGRQDVFAVSLAGALVPLSVWRTLGGADGWFTSFGESKDFCRRVCLNGGRVLVVPKAVIAHRRARLEGVRTRSGEAVDEDDALNSALQRITASQRYRITDVRRGRWPLQWLWLLVKSFGLFFALLFAKKPYEAACELALPWRALAGVAGASRARKRVARQSVTSLGRLGVLVANRQQLKRWRERMRAFESQRYVTLLSPLAKAHLRRQWRVRASWAAVMAVALAAAVTALRWNVVRGLFAGGRLASETLLPTGASYGQLVDAATTPYSFGLGVGLAGPPSPFLLVLAGAAVLTGGNVAAAMALIYLAAAPLSALSFWALAGVFTRSNPVRVVCGLLWGTLAAAMGLYHAGNLAMLVFMAFLPAAFAFTFRATAMYLTEDPVKPVASVQRAALASLCFIPVVDAEPQTLLPLLLVFVAFLMLVRRHRPTLLLIPVPAAFTLAPTLVNAVRHIGSGEWRELFADVMLPSSAANGAPQAMSLADITAHAFGLELPASWTDVPAAEHWLGVLAIVSVLALAALAVAALLLPMALRMSRMMWVVIIAGALLSLVSARVAVGVDGEGQVAGSVLPGFAMAMLGVIACVCQVAGGAVKRFNPLVGMMTSDRRAAQRDGKTAWARIGRTALTVALACFVALWGALGAQRTLAAGGVTATDRGLPMVAVDYLDQNPAHRILALSAQSSTVVDFTVMRTARGEIIDNTPVVHARVVSGLEDDATGRMATAASQLLSNGDAEAIRTLSDLGFGGVFVAPASGDVTDDPSYDALVSNITASEGTQSVVSNASGTYFRLTLADAATQGVDLTGLEDARANVWRWAWLWGAGVVVVLYVLVALPSIRRREQEQA
ncbi:glycosyltransferase [Bifidobacterium avesanii]|nr:glycosyltransferase [Bifidobacterium avesanii]